VAAVITIIAESNFRYTQVRSQLDGYTVGTIISVHASNVWLQPQLPYHPIKHITPDRLSWQSAATTVVRKEKRLGDFPSLRHFDWRRN